MFLESDVLPAASCMYSGVCLLETPPRKKFAKREKRNDPDPMSHYSLPW